MRTYFLFAPIVAGLALASRPAAADQIVRYDLLNVTFSGGQSATGYFAWDFTTSHPSACNIYVGTVPIQLGGAYPATVTTSSIDGAYDFDQVSYNLALVFSNAVTPTTGSSIIIDPLQSYFEVDPGTVTRFQAVTGSVEPVPEPKTAWALGVSLVGLGLMRRRR